MATKARALDLEDLRGWGATEGTQMERDLVGHVDDPLEPARLAADQLFEEEIAEGMPQGEALGMAEARVDYLLQRMSEEHYRMDRIKAAADARCDMIRDHAKEEAEKIQRRVVYLQAKIGMHVPLDGPGFKKLYGNKSLSLPHGKVGFKTVPASVNVTDAKKALAFAEANNLPVKVEKSVGKTALKEHVMRNGEEPSPETDGFVFIPARDEFYVSPELEF